MRARLEALIFGAGDLSASLRARVDSNFEPVGDYPGDYWHYVRVAVVWLPRARRASTPSTPRTPGYADLDGYRRAATHASLLGYDGKWAIHPSQVPVANEVFTPTADEIAEPARSSPTTVRPKREGSAPSGVTADSSTPH